MPLKFCTTCARLMGRELLKTPNALTGNFDYLVIFECPTCHEKIKGGEEDACILSIAVGGSPGNSTKHTTSSNGVALLAHDLTYKKINQTCTRCTLPYMTLVRSTNDERINVVCKCGNIEKYNISD